MGNTRVGDRHLRRAGATLPGMTWSWSYLKEDGSSADPGQELSDAGSSFPSQSDAETWVGEVWRDLREAGVDAVVLYEEERLVYGPMSLKEQ